MTSPPKSLALDPDADADRYTELGVDEAGPAVRIYSGKTRSRVEPAWKAIAPQVAQWLDEYVQHLGLNNPAASFWPSDRKPHKAMRPGSLTVIFSGSVATRALLPKDGYTVGCSAHTLPHLAKQLAYEAGWRAHEVERVIEKHSERKLRLVVSELDRSRIAPEVMRALKEVLRHPPI